MKIIQWNFYKGGFWVRFFGVGFSIVDKKIYRPLFSERNNYRHVLRFGKYGLELLRRV